MLESSHPKPTDPLPRYHVTQILEDYESNEARANANYKGRFIVTGIIEKVEDDGVMFEIGQSWLVSAMADFKDKEQLLQLDPGRNPMDLL